MRTLIITSALVLAQVASAGAQSVKPTPSDPAALRGTPGRPPLQSAPYGAWRTTPQARVWIDNDREYFRRGERIAASFTTSVNAYVAVVHIDPDGRLEFLYPSSPWDSEYVLAGRSYPLPYRNPGQRGWLVRSSPGIGYLYLIASPIPLDYTIFRARAGYGWDWSYGGQSVRGDPFWAFEQVTRYLVPDWGYTPLAIDYYSYQVGGAYRYPAYACSPWNTAQSWGWGWGGGYVPSYYGSCSRVDIFLRSNPYYFDTDRYAGDRRSYFRQYGANDPAHRYKENPEVLRPGAQTSAPSRGVTPVQGRTGTTAPRVEEPVQPDRRPTLERREPASQSTGRVTPSSGGGSTTPREPAPSQSPSPPPESTTPAQPRSRPTPEGGR